jgi:hypothetical protein
MRATELIDELYMIINDTNEDVELDEYWLRMLLNLNLQKHIDMKQALHIVRSNDDT